MPEKGFKLDPNRSPTHSREGKDFKLVWARDFREMLREHPGIIKVAIELADKAIDEYNPGTMRISHLLECRWNKDTEFWEVTKWGDDVLDTPKPIYEVFWARGVYFKKGKPQKSAGGKLEVTVLGKSKRVWGNSGAFEGESDIVRRSEIATYLKVKLNGSEFFVKRSSATKNPGYEQFKNTEKARVAVQGLDYIKVVEAQLGYRDRKESWYVSKWNNLETDGFVSIDAFEGFTPDDYGRRIPEKYRETYEKETEEVRGKIEEIKQALVGAGIKITDLELNLFYNPKTKIFLLIDVSDLEDVSLNNPTY